MAKSNVKNAVKYECDGCHETILLEREIESPIGLGGTAYEIHEGGGSGLFNWWACSRDCIEKAVLNAVTEGALDS